MSFRFLVLAVFVSALNFVHGQFTVGYAYDMAFPQTNQSYTYLVSDYNENETFTFYNVNSYLNPISNGLSIRNVGRQFNSTKKWKGLYSLEIGCRQFSTENRLKYNHSSTQNQDSIVNRLDGGTFKSKYSILHMGHYFDLHYNVTETIKITNSIGLDLSAIILTKSVNSNVRSASINENLPVLKLIYQFQVTEKYKRCAISYFTSIDCLAFELFRNPDPSFGTPIYGIPYYKIHFNSIGIRILPYPKVPKIHGHTDDY